MSVLGFARAVLARIRVAAAAAVMLAMGAGAAAAACQASLDFGGGGVGTIRTLDVTSCTANISFGGLYAPSALGVDAYLYAPVSGTKTYDYEINNVSILTYLDGSYPQYTLSGIPVALRSADVTLANGAVVKVTLSKSSTYPYTDPGQQIYNGWTYDQYTFEIVSLGSTSSSTVPLKYASSSVKLTGPAATVPSWPIDSPYDVAVTNMAATAPAGPSVTSISPTKGSTAGGTFVAINGTGFTASSTVKFGANPAASVTFVSATQLNATSPLGAAGIVDVTVTENGATSATSANTKFTYGAPPTLSAFSTDVPYNKGGGAATAFNAATLGAVTGNPTSYSIAGPSAKGATVSVNAFGVVSYTPPVGARGLDVFLLSASNDFGSATQPVTVTIGDPIFTASVTGNGTYKSPFAKPVTMTGGLAPYSNFSATGLPPGLTMNANGTITGTPTAAGPYSNVVITATDSSNPAYTASATAISITIDKLSQTIAFNTPGGLYLGPDVTLTASSSSGLDVTLTSTTTDVCTLSGTTLTPIKEGTCTIEATQAGDANYLAATKVTQNITLTGQVQTITFNNPGVQAVGAPKTLNATASSSLPVEFSAKTTPTVCSVNGTTISFLKTGTCTIAADQAGGGVYGAAPTVTRSFTVTKGEQTITFNNPGQQVFGTTPTLSASASSGLAVSLASTTSAVCSVNGATLDITATGDCTIEATQAGDTDYNAATRVSQTFAVVAADQTITFATIPTQTYGTPLDLTGKATASSKLDVAFTSASADVCTVAGTTVSFVKSGTCDIRANQAGDSNYAPAVEVARTFTVNKAAQVIMVGVPATQTYGAPLTVSANASSGLPPVFSSASDVCSVTPDGVVTLLKSGTCLILADEAGDDRYLAAPTEQIQFNVGKASQDITFNAPGQVSMGSTAMLNASTTAKSLAVTFTSTDTSICTVTTDGTLTPVKTGTCFIKAEQAGNDQYTAANPVTRAIDIAKAEPTAQLDSPQEVTLGGSGQVSVARTNSDGVPTFVTLSSSVCDVSDTGLVTPKTTGTCSIRVTIPATATYNQYRTNVSFAVVQIAQSITFDNPGPQKFASSPTLTATATSGLTVSFTASTPAVCTITPTGTLSFVKAGTCTVTAAQAGDATHAAATEVTRSFDVLGADPAIQQAIIQQFQTARATAAVMAQPDLLSFLLTPDAEGTFGLTMSSMGGDMDIFQKPGPGWLRLSGNLTTDQDGHRDHYVGLSFGSHRHIGDETILGLMATVDSMRMTQTLGVSEGTGWMVGPYLVTRLGQAPLYAELRAMTGRTDDTVTQTGLAPSDVPGTRSLFMLKLQGSTKAGEVTLMPNLSFATVHQSTDAYVAAGGSPVPSVATDYTRIAIGLDGSYGRLNRFGEVSYSGGIGLFVASDSAAADGRGLTYRFGMDQRFGDLSQLNLDVTGQADLANDANTLGLALAYSLKF